MREKAIPFRSLPLGIVIWERLVKPKPKSKFATRVKVKEHRYNPIKWKRENIIKVTIFDIVDHATLIGIGSFF